MNNWERTPTSARRTRGRESRETIKQTPIEKIYAMTLPEYKEILKRDFKIPIITEGNIALSPFKQEKGGPYTNKEVTDDLIDVKNLEEEWKEEEGENPDKTPDLVEKLVSVCCTKFLFDFTTRRDAYKEDFFGRYDFSGDEQKRFEERVDSIPPQMAFCMASKPDDYFEHIDSFLLGTEVLGAIDVTVDNNPHSRVVKKKAGETDTQNTEGGSLFYTYKLKDGVYVPAPADVGNFPHMLLVLSRNKVLGYVNDLTMFLAGAGQVQGRKRAEWEKKKKIFHTKIALLVMEELSRLLEVFSDESEMSDPILQNKEHLKSVTTKYMHSQANKFNFRHITGSPEDAEEAVARRLKSASDLREKIFPCLMQFANKRLLKLEFSDEDL